MARLKAWWVWQQVKEVASRLLRETGLGRVGPTELTPGSRSAAYLEIDRQYSRLVKLGLGPEIKPPKRTYAGGAITSRQGATVEFTEFCRCGRPRY